MAKRRLQDHPPYSRLALITITVLTVGAIVTGLLLYLAYGVRTDPGGSQRVDGLNEAVTLFWMPEGPIVIEATSTEDFLTGLGYGHGMNRMWISVLSRQIALGRLSEWMGQSFFPVDRLARSLRIDKNAEAAYSSLPQTVQTRYKKYADGMNAALRTKQVRRQAPLVLLEIEPEPWEPWHSLAVERLWAWIGTPFQLVDTEDKGVLQFQEADRNLRGVMHLFGMSDNLVVTAGGGAQQKHLFRYIHGDSGLSFFQAFEYVTSGRSQMVGLSIPGTIAVPAGRTGGLSWTFLLPSVINVDSVRISEDNPLRVDYDRIHDGSSTEDVVRIETIGNDLVIGDLDKTDSTQIVLRWKGLSHEQDATDWSALLDGKSPEFSIIRSDGIVIDSDGESHILGMPTVVFTHPSGVKLITNSESGDSIVDRLIDVIAGRTDVQSDWDLLHDSFSQAAIEESLALLATIDSVQFTTALEREAVEYIRNWDHSYRGSSIAASILEYTKFFRSETALLSKESESRAIRAAVGRLSEQFGSDIREWRWESVQSLTLYYPGWTGDQLDGDRLRKFSGEFPPVGVVGQGHPTTLTWGPTLGRRWAAASSAAQGHFGHTSDSIFEMERPLVTYSTFLGRFLAEYRARVVLGTESSRMTERQTELIPMR